MVSNIVILSGAGISAESGLGTFRDEDGLWTKYDLSEVATPEGYARNPDLVLDFYNARRRNCVEALPNAAHQALAELEAGFDGSVMLVTQNVDDLHERGGAQSVVHMHGELRRALCALCEHRWDWDGDMTRSDRCPSCKAAGAVRPDIVWFGEMPYHLEKIWAALAECDLFIAIGTSGQVYPAAGFVADARHRGATTVEINLEDTNAHGLFDHQMLGPASDTVPRAVAAILRGAVPGS